MDICIDDDISSVGEKLWEIRNALFEENRKRLCERLREIRRVPKSALILLQGGDRLRFHDTLKFSDFRQEPYFYWAFGVHEPGCYGIIQVRTALSILFVPHYTSKDALRRGSRNLEDYRTLGIVDEVYYVEDMFDVIQPFFPTVLLTLYGKNSDSGLMFKEASFPCMRIFNVDNTFLFPVMSDCRVFKNKYEIDVLRYVNKIASDAYRYVMRKVHPGMYEYQCEAMFLHFIYYVGGCDHSLYVCKCTSGKPSALLYYGNPSETNSKLIEKGDICSFDMGASYSGYYCSISRSFPANGIFTEDQTAIYTAVLDSLEVSLSHAKPGVSVLDLHILATRRMLSHLTLLGVLTGDLDDMMTAGIGAIFQPHGLCHFIGLCPHDVGGYLPRKPLRPTTPSLKMLRTTRVLEPGMVLKFGPACYFIERLINQALEDPIKKVYFVPKVLDRFRNFGGVRIADCILITEEGIEDLTKVPKTIKEIEELKNTITLMVPFQDRCELLQYMGEFDTKAVSQEISSLMLKQVKEKIDTFEPLK